MESVGEATVLYQAALEESRANPHDEDLAKVVAYTKAEMERIWRETVGSAT